MIFGLKNGSRNFRDQLTCGSKRFSMQFSTIVLEYFQKFEALTILS